MVGQVKHNNNGFEGSRKRGEGDIIFIQFY